MRLFRGRKQDETLAERDEHLQRLQAECRVLQARLDDTRELVRHLDEDRDVLLDALERMHPERDIRILAQVLLEVSFKPLGLACFYVAVADWDRDLLQFVLYHEGGRTRDHPTRPLSDRVGLSERVLSERRSVYIRTAEEGQAAGSLLTPAEQATGLIPHSWYGAPLGWGPRPLGLVSFQSFHPDAFSESRCRVMDALAALMSTCLGDWMPPQMR